MQERRRLKARSISKRRGSLFFSSGDPRPGEIFNAKDYLTPDEKWLSNIACRSLYRVRGEVGLLDGGWTKGGKGRSVTAAGRGNRQKEEEGKRRGETQVSPGPGWLAFEAGQKNGGRTTSRREKKGREGGSEANGPSPEQDRARTRARGTRWSRRAQEVNVQGGNLFGVHGPLD